MLARVRAVLNGVRADRQQAAIQHEHAAAGHAAHGDAAAARLEGRLATQHRQRLADVEAALEALDAAVLDLTGELQCCCETMQRPRPQEQ